MYDFSKQIRKQFHFSFKKMDDDIWKNKNELTEPKSREAMKFEYELIIGITTLKCQILEL